MKNLTRGVQGAFLLLTLTLATGCSGGGADYGNPMTMASSYNASVSLEGFTPHVGQTFKLRIVNANDPADEVFREVVLAVPSPDFTVAAMGVLTAGTSYNIDFYADMDGSGAYTPPAPPMWPDHAWRISVGPVSDHVTITFPHDMNWTDVAFPDL